MWTSSCTHTSAETSGFIAGPPLPNTKYVPLKKAFCMQGVHVEHADQDILVVGIESTRHFRQVLQGVDHVVVAVHPWAVVCGFGGRQEAQVGERVVGVDVELLGIDHFHGDAVVNRLQCGRDLDRAQVQGLVRAADGFPP